MLGARVRSLSTDAVGAAPAPLVRDESLANQGMRAAFALALTSPLCGLHLPGSGALLRIAYHGAERRQ